MHFGRLVPFLWMDRQSKGATPGNLPPADGGAKTEPMGRRRPVQSLATASPLLAIFDSAGDPSVSPANPAPIQGGRIMLKSWFLPAVFLGVVVGLASGAVRDAFASCSVSYSGSVDTCTDGDAPDELNDQNMHYTRTVYWISTGQTGTITFVHGYVPAHTHDIDQPEVTPSSSQFQLLPPPQMSSGSMQVTSTGILADDKSCGEFEDHHLPLPRLVCDHLAGLSDGGPAGLRVHPGLT